MHNKVKGWADILPNLFLRKVTEQIITKHDGFQRLLFLYLEFLCLSRKKIRKKRKKKICLCLNNKFVFVVDEIQWKNKGNVRKKYGWLLWVNLKRNSFFCTCRILLTNQGLEIIYNNKLTLLRTGLERKQTAKINFSCPPLSNKLNIFAFLWIWVILLQEIYSD